MPIELTDEEIARLWSILLDPTTVLDEADVLLMARASKRMLSDILNDTNTQ